MLNWRTERDRVDLARVATELLGEPPGRRGERGRKLWWHCPFHGDTNPSFYIDPGKPWWKCLGCGEHGDAAGLVMRLERLDFPGALRRLLGDSVGPTTYRPTPPPPPTPPGPRGLPEPAARALVADGEARLWSSDGAEARAYLTGDRHLTEATIRAARLGWTPRVDLPTQDGRTFAARGVVIPWFDGDRLALVKIRQPGDARPKYAEAFRDRPACLLGTPLAAGRPLVVVEGEFDVLLVGQELHGLAVVATLGPASVRPDPATLGRFLGTFPWFVATDDDEAGDRAADAWTEASGTAVRVRPPETAGDWTKARQLGVDLRRWWSARLANAAAPNSSTWKHLAGQRWGGADDASGLDIPADWRHDLAGWPSDRWCAWHRRVGDLLATRANAQGGMNAEVRAGLVRDAQRRAYDEMLGNSALTPT